MENNQQAEAAYKIWMTFRNALEKKVFTTPLLVSICEEEESAWQDYYISLTAKETQLLMTELGLAPIQGGE